ncbi:MAG: CRISPR-associated endonuclease Cas1, partial [Intestinibacter bartlettii]
FVFDLIEMYRIYIDKIVFKLFTTKKVKKEHFDKVEGGLYLNKAGKEILISKYNEEIEKKIQYKGRKIELQNIIQYDCHNIANKILKGEIDLLVWVVYDISSNKVRRNAIKHVKMLDYTEYKKACF